MRAPVGRGLRLALFGGMAYAMALAVALVVVLWRSPHPITPELPGTNGCSPADLAHYCRGVRARVSSFHSFGSHHPMYAIDGQDSSDLVEKWTSAPEDRAPWIELSFPEPVSFSTVRLTHAGTAEASDYTMRSYRLSCTAAGKLRASLGVVRNEASKPSHELHCRDVDRLRIDFDVEPGTARALTRLYEIEVAP